MNRLAKALFVLCALALPMTAFAIVPDPSLSATPPCVRMTVDGSFNVSGQVFGTDGNTLGNEEVRLIFSAACDNLRLCPDASTPPQFILSTTSAGDGTFNFAPEGGGCCAESGAAELHADPGDVTLLPVYNNVGSPDNGGDGTPVSDLSILLTDFSRFAQAFGDANNPCFDYTVTQPASAEFCDGAVTLTDFSIFSIRFLQAPSCN